MYSFMLSTISSFFEVISSNPVIIALLVIGIVLCIIEAVIPGFGIFGVLGIAFEVAGVVYHAIASRSPLQVFILILVVALLTLLIFLIFVRSAKFGLLGKTAIIEHATALPINYDKDIETFKNELIGKLGVALVDLHPVGKIKVGENNYLEVLSKSGLVEKGEIVKIVDVEGTKVFVSKVNN